MALRGASGATVPVKCHCQAVRSVVGSHIWNKGRKARAGCLQRRPGAVETGQVWAGGWLVVCGQLGQV